MSNPRLPFLYPNLLRSVRACEPTSRSLVPPQRASTYNRQNPALTASFHSSRRRSEQETRRYGPARDARVPPPAKPQDGAKKNESVTGGRETSHKNEGRSPQSHQQKPAETAEGSRKSDQKLKSTGSTPATESQKASASSGSNAAKTTAEEQQRSKKSPLDPSQSSSGARDTPANSNASSDQGRRESTDENSGAPDQSESEPPPANPLDTVLQMPPPPSHLAPLTVASHNGKKPPHLSPPRYVHHFDTYGLVKDLEKGGFPEDQAVTVMKSIRGILQDKLELARESLTSKSDVENELYLFKAACSELQTSLQTARNAEIQRQRSSRTHLQHEVDIITQRLNQELARLNDELKGMFNDHKMTSKELKRSIDTAIQELNYQITISLNSDGKSEAEGLRWVLTRRAAMAIATSAIMIILFLKYYSVRTHEQKVKEGAAAATAAKEVASASHPAGKDAGVQTENSLSDALVSESLG